MVVRRAALHRQEELRAFSRVARGPGFAAEVAALIAACKQACISPEMLLSAADALPAGALLSDKLHDAALLYADVETYLNGRYLTEDDFYAAATALLPGSFVDGVPVYLDGLPAVTRQVFSFLEALLPVAQSMTVALTIDDGAPDADVFGPNAEAWDALRDMAARLHLPLFERRLTGRRAADPALSHLERRLFAYPDEPYGAAAPAITVFGANSRTAEVRAMCDAVLALARGGVRYRDMAVLVSDMDEPQPRRAPQGDDDGVGKAVQAGIPCGERLVYRIACGKIIRLIHAAIPWHPRFSGGLAVRPAHPAALPAPQLLHRQP